MTEAASIARSGEVDALRCFAMLAVIALHAHILPFGWIGVWLFYVISGYVVTLTVLERRARPDHEPLLLRDFLSRRAMRILPLYYGYLCVGLATAALLGAQQDALSLASLFLFFDNVTVIQGFGRISGWPSGHLWTLSVEMQFYLIYGGVLCLLPARTTRRLLVAFILLCPLARFMVGLWLESAQWRPLDAAYAVYVAPGLHFDIFAMGALLAFSKRAGALDRIARPLATAGFAALALFSVAYYAVNVTDRGAHGTTALRNIVSGILFGEHREALVYSAVGLAMAGLVTLAASGDRLLAPLLRIRLLQRIGETSYGGYVYHQFALLSATALIGPLGLNVKRGAMLGHGLQFLIGTCIALLLAEASFRWFETPVRRALQGKRRPRHIPYTLGTTRMETP